MLAILQIDPERMFQCRQCRRVVMYRELRASQRRKVDTKPGARIRCEVCIGPTGAPLVDEKTH